MSGFADDWDNMSAEQLRLIQEENARRAAEEARRDAERRAQHEAIEREIRERGR
jgi:hypothetical protein